MCNKIFGKKDYNKLMKRDGESHMNQNHIILSFIDFDFDSQLITNKLQIKPHSTGIKGEDYYIGSKKQTKRKRDCNHWEFEEKVISNEFIGNLVSKFFEDVIKPRVKLIKELAIKCETLRLLIVQYYYTGHNPGFELTREQIKILAEINADVDIDFYCLCEEEK